MAWRLAKSLETFRAQVNARFPGRAKASDGTIGDAAHAARDSDHNPDSDGVVKALDVTTDPTDDTNTEALAEHLRQTRDPRLKYVIYDRRMYSSYPAHGVAAFEWRPYSGKNPHIHHFHLSVHKDAARYDDETPWSLDGAFSGVFGQVTLGVVPVLKIGAEGANVRKLQKALNAKVGPVLIDGSFGPKTLAAVRAFQAVEGLRVDGVVGPKTWAKLG